jgi:hypothetical protein
MNPKKKKKNNSTDPTTKSGVEIMPHLDYPLIESDEAMAKVLRLIDENLGPQKFSVLNLSRIKVPAGGGAEFRVESASGAELMRQISAVIPAFRQVRLFYQKPYGTGTGKKPPDCTSNDGFTGVGNPGGDCLRCPNAAFGTSINPDGSRGTGQACKEIRQLLVLLPGQLLPHILNVPPTSIRNFMQYSMNLISAGVMYWGVVTKLSLEPATSTSGIDFARISFSLERRLEKEQVAMLEPYHQRMRGFLQPMIVDATAYEINGEKSEQESADSEVPF